MKSYFYAPLFTKYLSITTLSKLSCIFSAVEDKVKTFDPRALNPSTNKQEETRSRGKTIEGMAISVVEFQNYTDLW